MAYNKTNWTPETPINTENLNKIEEGIAANDEALGNKQDKLIAGENITIEEDGTIKASGSNVINSKDIEDKENNTYSAEIIDELVQEVYSTEEQVVGTWVDGKPLYRKVIDIGNLPSSLEKVVNTGITNAIIRNMYGSAINGTTQIPLPYIFPDTSGTITNIALIVRNGGSNLHIYTGIDRSAWTGYVTLEYTKTTD